MKPWTRKQQDFVRLHFGPLAQVPWRTERIALALDRTPKAIRAAARQMGLSWRFRRGTQPRAFYGHYCNGYSDRQIACAADCSVNTVLRWRKREGLPPVGKPGPRTYDARRWCDVKRLVRKRRREGCSCATIARELGVHSTTVCRWVRRLEGVKSAGKINTAPG